jgi:hypothetical protein
MTDNKNTDINPPVISEETIRELSKFFIKTSIPRILAEKKASAE